LIDKYLNFRYALFEKKKLILKNKYLRWANGVKKTYIGTCL
jgi:hypothetical protein